MSTLNVGQLEELMIAAQRAVISAVAAKKDKFVSATAQVLVEDYGPLVPFFEKALDEYLDAKRVLRLVVPSVSISAVTKPFVVRDYFQRDVSQNAKVKISYLGNNFSKWFWWQSIGPRGGYNLAVHELTKSLLDDDIRAELGESCLNDMAAIYQMMAQQPNGEKGNLLNNGYANIFYVVDPSVSVRTVYVYWGVDGWYVIAVPVDYPDPWHDGLRVCSRNS